MTSDRCTCDNVLVRRLAPLFVLLPLASCSGASPAPAPAPSTKASAASTASAASPEAEKPTAPRDEPPPDPPKLPDVTLSFGEPREKTAKAPSLRIVAPTAGQVVPAAKAADFLPQLVAKDWQGGSLCISLDAKPCVVVDDPSKPPTLSSLGKLGVGQHLLAFFARGPRGEVVRAKGAGAVVVFHVDKKEKGGWKAGDPVIVPSFPPAGSGERVIDFFLANAEAAPGKFLVQLGVVGPGASLAESSDEDRPFRLKNPRKGTYTVRLALARYSPELGESKATTTVRYVSKTVTTPFGDGTTTLEQK